MTVFYFALKLSRLYLFILYLGVHLGVHLWAYMGVPFTTSRTCNLG